MNQRELEEAVEAATSHQGVVDLVTAFFESRDLHYGHGTESAEGEANWLVAASLEWDEDRWAAPPEPRVLSRIAALAWQRAEDRVPLAYLLGEAWFARLRYYVDRSVLVPRSPLAELIENEFAPWLELRPGDRVLDVGTGSGCIAIAIAYYMRGITVDATDVSPEALALARRNAESLAVDGRVNFIEADLFPGGDAKYRVIIANPPYVPTPRLAELPAEYGHEPELGLDGGRDGLDAVRPLLAGARSRLASDGVLIVEVGEADEALEAEFPRLPLTWLEFERGGTGVFLLTRDELEAAGL